MSDPVVKFATLSQEQLGKVHDLESELGKIVVAFEPLVRLADLDIHQLTRLKAVEQELGVVLIAYEKK